MPVVIIAEKPSVATDIAKVLGVKSKQQTHWESDEIIVTWAVGHLLELKTPVKNMTRRSKIGENQSINSHLFRRSLHSNRLLAEAITASN